MSQIDSLFRIPHHEVREIAVEMLASKTDIDTSDALNYLYEAFVREIENPTSHIVATNSVLTETECILIYYKNGFIRYGEKGKAFLKSKLGKVNTEIETRIILILGAMCDPSVHDKIGSIYYESANPYIRLQAIRSLKVYSDTTDILVYMAALKDDLYEVHGDLKLYATRGTAAGMLREFGFDVKVNRGEYTVSPKK